MTLESLRPVIDAPRDESKIQPSRHGPQRRLGRRDTVKFRFSGREIATGPLRT
jgi:hypothetical protein